MHAIPILTLFAIALTSAWAWRARSWTWLLLGAQLAVVLAPWSLWISGWSLTAII